MKRFLPALPLLLAVTNAFAQDATAGDEVDKGSALGAMIGGTCGCIGGLIGLAIWICLIVYVYRDSKARGMDNAILLTIVTAFTGILGLIIYLLMRPKGALVTCPSCGKKRLAGSVKCPHCGNP
ncbi:MAG: hypothetical protein ACR2ID_00835 [Chthoniobacterales bacterium]